MSQLGVTKALETKQPMGDYVTQLAFNKGLTNKIDKTQLVGTTGNSADKVISQKACNELFAKKESQEVLRTGNIVIKSGNDSSGLMIERKDGVVCALQTSPDSAYFSYGEGGKGIITIPYNKTGTLALTTDVDAINNYPVGAPIPWPQSTPPEGYFVCNGNDFDKVKYPQLALAYPSGKLPILYGEFIRGLDLDGNIDPGRAALGNQGDAARKITGKWNGGVKNKKHTDGSVRFIKDRIWGIDGELTSEDTDFNNGNGPTEGWDAYELDSSLEVPTANENRPRNVAFLYIVRAA
ncbi:phage tail protein [Arsenophonus nasoniae]|uniref:phage tail protein n=1 Tax=Arsenophonus nasoniae TaxID=638 RepID=UPI003879E234